MKFTALILGTYFLSATAFSAPIPNRIEGTYDLYLYFSDNAPFLDELTLDVDPNGGGHGHMHVPNDFDAELESISIAPVGEKQELSFHISLPKKYENAYPNGLDYKISFLRYFAPEDYDHFTGFVTTYPKGSYRPKYVGSVVGFKKK